MADYTGFRFGNFYSKDLHLVVVSSNDRYNKEVLPENQDYTIDVPGGDGQYYFGSTFSSRTFEVNVAFDSIDEITWRRISNLFSTDKVQDLVFDELPYKTFKAKLKNKPEFKFICFFDRDKEQRVYKGEGTLEFVCYYPYAFGFNKYIIRAADNYLVEVPDLPNYDSKYDNPYEKKPKKVLNKKTKDFYNVEKNMGIPWKGGYPTIEQVRAGELFFKDEENKLKIIDVRKYFRNVPEWAESSRLLVSPTLDYEQDLIYIPQYSKTDYVNMDIGFHSSNALIGSRMLVYNPGDIPIDYEIRFNNKLINFLNDRGKHFRIRKFNVQRLSIPEAVDWAGLRTQKRGDNDKFKYGKKYLKFIDNSEIIEVNGYKLRNCKIADLSEKHPKHVFIAEPIPKERLGHYIKLFYWQSKELDFKKGVELANRYEELFKLCITEQEQYELYWKTLKEVILLQYKNQAPFNDDKEDINDFIYNFIHNPPEFIRENSNLEYGQVILNLQNMPQWISEEYYDIVTDNLHNTEMFLNSEHRTLYSINDLDREKEENFFDYKPIKEFHTENIKKGKWFKLQPGWSLIEVVPVCDEDIWGGKRWLDARPFFWGYGGKDGQKQLIQSVFDTIYDLAAKSYLLEEGLITSEELKNPAIIDEKMLFRKYYDKDLTDAINNKNIFAQEYYKTKQINLEYGFLRKLHTFWKAQRGVQPLENNDFTIKGDIDEWWWYACNYIWGNFPPLYWGYADLLNAVTIKYTPLFY